MTTFTGTSGNDIANAITGQLVGFTGGTVADLQDANADTFIALDGADVIFASDAGARLLGQDGADEMHGGASVDVFNFRASQIVAGETIDGGGGSDIILLEESGGTFDFTVGVSIRSIEEISVSAGPSSITTVKLLASQFGDGGISRSLHLSASSSANSVVSVQITMGDVTSLDLSGFSFNTNFDSLDRIEVFGDSDSETIIGTSQRDVLFGNGGNDTLDGGRGADSLAGGTGNDIYVVDNTGDSITEASNEGTDEVRTAVLSSFNLNALPNVENLTNTGTSNFTGIGNAGANVLIGGTGNDYLIGLDGNDSFIDGTGLNTFQGGLGNDIYAVQLKTDSPFEFADEGTDQVQTFLASYTLPANIENLTFIGAIAHTGTGNNLNNVLVGAGGDDTLIGLDGNDFFIDGIGRNTFQGGPGNDVYAVQSNTDIVVERADEGTDEVQTFLSSFVIPANVENLTFIGAVAHVGTGNNLANVIIGAGGNDTLLGGAGAANTLKGGAGNDTYVVEAAGDVIVELANQGIDTVQTPLSALTLAANVENLTHTGSSDFTGIGNTANNVLIGGTGNDYLIGLEGNDVLIDNGGGLNTLQGGKGNDIYAVQSSSDSVFEFSDEGSDEVQTFLASYVLPANVERLVFIGASAHTGTGNVLANVFTGGSGNDTFTGAGGGDRFDYISGSGNGSDTITDFDADISSSGHDVINLSGRGLAFNQLSVTAKNGGTLVEIPGGDSIFLQNVAVGLVDGTDFLF